MIGAVDHNEVLGSCNSAGCHSLASGHIASTSQCDACHNTAAFIPAVSVDHNEVIGSCNRCHDGSTVLQGSGRTILGKNAGHVPTAE